MGHMTTSDLREIVAEAYYADRNREGWVHEVALDGTWAIIGGSNKLTKVSVTWDGSEVSGFGDPVPVRREVHYVPIGGDDSAAVQGSSRILTPMELRAEAVRMELAAFTPCDPCKTPRMCTKDGVCAKGEK